MSAFCGLCAGFTKKRPNSPMETPCLTLQKLLRNTKTEPQVFP